MEDEIDTLELRGKQSRLRLATSWSIKTDEVLASYVHLIKLEETNMTQILFMKSKEDYAFIHMCLHSNAWCAIG